MDIGNSHIKNNTTVIQYIVCIGYGWYANHRQLQNLL